ncbi:MAG: bacterial transcriptional activator domain-containing protein [Myxococcota bacterium]|nr:bacterial transcriptional activator domain-containing protein [Myxococcota bacterium]
MKSAPQGGRTRGADAVATAALLWAALLVLGIAARPVATDDLWWHLALGGVYAQEGVSVSEDPLFHTAPGQPTVPHEWLFQIGVHGVERLTGFHGLRALHAGLVGVLIAWTFLLLRRAAGSTALAACALTVWLALSWYRLIQFRPELVSLLAILGLTSLLFTRAAPPGAGRIVACLALLVAWANTHSLVAIGPALLLAAAAGLALERVLLAWTGDNPEPSERTRAPRMALLFGLALVVIALNPRGFAQHTTFFVESASGDIWRLHDDFLSWVPWAPASANPALTPLAWALSNILLLLCLGVVGIRAVRFWRARSGESARQFDALFLALAAASFVAMATAVRFHWLALFPLLYLLRAARGTGIPARRLAAVAAVAIAAALPGSVGLAAFRSEVARESGGYWSTPWLDARYCGPAARFLDATSVRGRLFHPFNFGGFFGYWLAPELRTFIDGRLDHVPSEVLDDYVEIRRGVRMGDEDRFAARLDAYAVDFFVGSHFEGNRYNQGTWTDHLRRFPDWIPVFVTQECGIYLRRGPRNAQNLERIAAYYAEHGIPFDSDAGPDLGRTWNGQRVWAVENGVAPPDLEELGRGARAGDPEALDALARALWRIGAWDAQIPIERQLLALEPERHESRRRLADALLQPGDRAGARRHARVLLELDPPYSDARTIYRLARTPPPRRPSPAPGAQTQNGADSE